MTNVPMIIILYVFFFDVSAVTIGVNMKIRIGDFTSKLDAERALKIIRKDYSGAYIVQDKIELPDLDAPLFGTEDE